MKTLRSVILFSATLMHILAFSKAMVLPNSSDIFSLQKRTVVDEIDLLEEHGRFMSGNMNKTVDPCENFYEYACGNWANNTMVPEFGRNKTLVYTMETKLEELLVGYLKNTAAMEENTAETKAKQLFSSCLEMSEDLNQGYNVMLNSVKDPVLKDKEPLDWMAINFYSGYRVTPLLPLTIGYNQENFMFEIVISPPYNNLVNVNFTKVSEDLKIENVDEVKKEFEELKVFEKQLVASASFLSPQKPQTLEEFIAAHNTSKVDWKRFFNLAFNKTYENSYTIHNNVKNFTHLNRFLLRSSNDLLLKYVKWRDVLKFYNIWVKNDTKKSLESRCLKITSRYFSYALMPWFIEATYDRERREDLLLLTKSIKDTFYSFLDQYSWLDSETRSAAKSKLRSMDFTVGYTDEMRHRHTMNSGYKDVNITKDYWTNLIHLEKNIARTLIKVIGKSEILATTNTYHVNAFYSEHLNLASLPIGFSQTPLYDIKLPKVLKFGGIGAIIGHEISHGFDTNCFARDYDGKKRNWWSADSLRNFKERYQCFESQYNKFIYNGYRTNGNRTQSENIADNAGARFAYHSYLRHIKDTQEKIDDKPLPGMDYSNKQLFFIKFAQTWCDGRSLEDRMRIMKSGDEHAFEVFRVVGTLRNMPEFSETFHCPLGSDMNPLKKCIVW